MKKNSKIILAYSGGLDTSVICMWLKNRGYEVICYVADVGQKENFKEVEEKAYRTGASKVYVEDLREEFVKDYIFPAMCGNALYEGTYLLGTAIARPLIAKKQVETGKREGTSIFAHGATGKGNDQVRFEYGYYSLCPSAVVISPWKDRDFLNEFKGREDMLNYAEKHGIPVKASKERPYSEDDNLLHVSHEAGILEDPAIQCPSEVYSMSLSPKEAPDRETDISLTFRDGVPVSLLNISDNVEKQGALEIFLYLNELGYKNGIGRIDIVENRYVGIKSRGIYEAPGGTILWKAHRDLEGIAMDKEVMHIRDFLIPKFSQLIYNGMWFSPEMDFLMSAFRKSQKGLNGTVTMSLYKGNVDVTGRTSPVSLYNMEMSSMEVEGGYNAIDCQGFININAIRLKAHNSVMGRGE